MGQEESDESEFTIPESSYSDYESPTMLAKQLMMHGQPEYKRGRYRVARVNFFEKAMELDGVAEGTRLYSVLLVCDCLYFENRFEGSLERALALATEVVTNWSLLGLYMSGLGAPPLSVLNWGERARFLKGFALYRLCRLEDAYWSLTEAIQFSEYNIAAYLLRAEVYGALLRFDDAEKDLEAANYLANNVPRHLLSPGSFDVIENIPLIEAIIHEGRRAADLAIQRGSVDEFDYDSERFYEERALGMATGSKTKQFDWNDLSLRIEIEDSLKAAENDHRLINEFSDVVLYDPPKGYVLRHRSRLVDLNSRRLKYLDSLISFYVSNPNDRIELLDERGVGMMERALVLSDLFKSMPFFPCPLNRSFNEMFLTLSDYDDFEGVLIICYHVIPLSEEDYRLVRWAIQDGDIVSFQVKNVKDLKAKVVFLSSVLLASLQDIGATRESQVRNCLELYELLLSGLGSLLEDNSHILFVPDTILFRVPFNCLLSEENGHYLIETHSISISCSLWSARRGVDRLEKILLTRDPSDSVQSVVCEFQKPIPQDPSKIVGWQEERITFRSEVDSVMRLSSVTSRGSICLRGNSFTPDNIRNSVNEFQPLYVHLVSHGSPQDPESVRQAQSGNNLYEFDLKGSLACSVNGPVLRAETVAIEFNLSHTSLVYLSSCSLADGEMNDVGILGFYRACLMAGCPSVVCALWPVLSGFSTRIAGVFYQCHVVRGMDKAESLRKAIRSFLSAKVGRRTMREFPSLWAPFQLFGSRM